MQGKFFRADSDHGSSRNLGLEFDLQAAGRDINAIAGSSAGVPATIGPSHIDLAGVGNPGTFS